MSLLSSSVSLSAKLRWGTHGLRNWDQQGLVANFNRYRDSPVMHPEVLEEWKPAIFDNEQCWEFPLPTKQLKWRLVSTLRCHEFAFIVGGSLEVTAVFSHHSPAYRHEDAGFLTHC